MSVLADLSNAVVTPTTAAAALAYGKKGGHPKNVLMKVTTSESDARAVPFPQAGVFVVAPSAASVAAVKPSRLVNVR